MKAILRSFHKDISYQDRRIEVDDMYDFTAGPHHEINEDLCPVVGSNQDIVPCVEVTPAQEQAMVRLHGEWAVVNEPKLYPCVPGPVVVDVVGDSGVGMSLVIETDGYVHS